MYLGEGRRFDRERVLSTLRNTPGVSRLSTDGDRSAVSCEFRYHDDFTIIRLASDQETVVIEGSGDASLQAAVMLQSGYPEPMRLVDEGYTFDLSLSGVGSLRELHTLVVEAERG
jgi:hypothetical protein